MKKIGLIVLLVLICISFSGDSISQTCIDITTILPDCSAGQVVRWASGAWTCQPTVEVVPSASSAAFESALTAQDTGRLWLVK